MAQLKVSNFITEGDSVIPKNPVGNQEQQAEKEEIGPVPGKAGKLKKFFVHK